MIDATNLIIYDHERFMKEIADITQQVKNDTWKPDYIVGIVRGGAVPATYLSHSLKIPVVMVAWSARDNMHGGNESNCWIPEDINCGMRVLLVDDIVDGGDTVRELIADWQKSSLHDLVTANIRIASLVANEAQETAVAYAGTRINRNDEPRWFVFEWEG